MYDQWPDLTFSIAKGVFLFRNGHLYELDLSYSDKNDYYGITWDNKHVFVSCGDVVVKFDSSLKDAKELSYFGRGIHQVFYVDDKLYIMNTGHNVISVFDPNENKLIKDIKWTLGKKHDVEHINSIFKYKGEFFVCAHNHKNPSFLIRFNGDFECQEVYRGVGEQIHNVLVFEDHAYVLNSKNCGIIKFNIKSGMGQEYVLNFSNYENIIGHDNFLRGLAKTKDHFFIGVCSKNEKRENRNENYSYIVRTDLSFNLIDCLKVPKVSQIKDIRIISEFDYAHNGIKYPLEFDYVA